MLNLGSSINANLVTVLSFAPQTLPIRVYCWLTVTIAKNKSFQGNQNSQNQFADPANLNMHYLKTIGQSN